MGRLTEAMCGRTFQGALALVEALPFEGWLEGSRGSPCSDYIGFLLDPRLALGGSVVVETMSLLNTLLCLRPQVPLGCAGVIWKIRDMEGEYRLLSGLGN